MANACRDAGRQFGTKISDALVRVGRCSVENITHGFLSAVHYGKKKELPPISEPLLLEPAGLLAKKIRRGEVSSLSVVKAYIERINEVDPIINAVVDSRFSEALSEAADADELLRSGTLTEEQLEKDLPLLGVPFTSKEACLVKGLSSTCGLMCRKGLKAIEDSDPVRALRAAGAIPVAVSNTSEVCMWWETYNKLHGLTKNPYDTTRTVGGSSGGEAALIAAAGSLIGLGTDLGGSIRLPCFFVGIFGHKPSAGLVPYGGQFPPVLNDVAPYVVSGPMARYATDLRLMMKILVSKDASSRLNLENQVPLQSIKVYYMLDDGGQPARTPVHPELKERMLKVLSWMREMGATVQSVNIENLKYGFMIWCSCLSRIKDQSISALMSGEVKESVKPLRQEMLKWFSGKSDYTFPVIMNACVQDYVSPLLEKPLDTFFNRGTDLKREFDDLLRGDAVFIYPTYPTPAPHHGQILVTPMNVGYNVVFNTLGVPVTHCPLGLTSAGLPIGVQVVAAHNNDRLCLSVAEQIEQKFMGWIRP